MQSFWSTWGGWLSKLTAVLLAAAYLIVISLVHNSPYVWLSLILVLMLCLTLFAYTRDTPIIRWGRRRNNSQTNTANNQNEEPQMTEVPTAVWMTDIPPSYSFVMETNPPVTPPPSYGSALIMFPWMATGQQSPDTSRFIENTRFRSVSRQVSEVSGIYICNSSISRQNSRADTISNGLCPTPLSRQTSRQDGVSTARQLSAISRQLSHATVLSRQISLQENKQNEQEQDKKQDQEDSVSIFIQMENNLTIEKEDQTDDQQLQGEESIQAEDTIEEEHSSTKNTQ